MTITATHHQLARHIDDFVNRTLAAGGGDEALLVSLYDYMGNFKILLDTLTSDEINALCAQYDGFYHFAHLLEHLASGIADGRIPVPK
ncbi:MAG: arylsulfatase regulator [Candidatus Competibacteraceae bacterium]|nr:arylsulfatase regulator [Candidatus Competibacteraceae bacterium]